MKAWKERPSDNLELFLGLDSLVTAKEQEKDIATCFWRIPKDYNSIANGLAMNGAGVVRLQRRLTGNRTMW